MTQFKATAPHLEEYLRNLNVLQPMPVRCDMFFKPRFQNFFPNSKEGFECLRRLFCIASTHDSIIIKLKVIICLHHLVMTKSYLHEEILDSSIPHLEGSEQAVTTGDAYRWLTNIANVYYNYVRRACANSEIYLSAKNGKTFTTKEPVNSLITRVYLLMNLIKSVFAAKEFILNFGRYFKAEYPLVIDISKCIAQDLAQLYNSLSEMINHLIHNYKTKLAREEVKQLLMIVDQTYLLHESLYVLFYNRYYAYEIEAPGINWVKMQSQEYNDLKNEAKGKRKKMSGSKASIDSLDISQFQKTYYSNVESKEDVLDNIEI